MVVSVIIIGCGNRGSVYAKYALENPEKCKVVAVADPIEIRREKLGDLHHLPKSKQFEDWQSVIQHPKMADAVVIATQDRLHAEPAIAFAKKGYHILLEKPMAPTEEECYDIYNAVDKSGIIFAIGHVLRYTPYTKKIMEIISSGVLGDIINVQHLEPVGYWHFAHSYVRGNWRNTQESSPMILAKSCHDLDWLMYVIGKKCLKVSSFGTLKHFKKENKPENATSRCLDCPIENTCEYSAKKIYLDSFKKEGNHGFPVCVIVDKLSEKNVIDALQNGPYGRCVYECDNDVVDNQVVNLLFEDDITASFTVVGTSEEVCVRKTKIFGTKGELVGDGYKITVFKFLDESKEVIYPDDPPLTSMLGHSGGDYYLMHDFIEAVEKKDPSILQSTPKETLHAHLIVFAAEKARQESTVVDMSW